MGEPAFRTPSRATKFANALAVKAPRAEAKDEDLVAVIVVLDDPLVRKTDVLIESLAEHATRFLKSGWLIRG